MGNAQSGNQLRLQAPNVQPISQALNENVTNTPYRFQGIIDGNTGKQINPTLHVIVHHVNNMNGQQLKNCQELIQSLQNGQKTPIIQAIQDQHGRVVFQNGTQGLGQSIQKFIQNLGQNLQKNGNLTPALGLFILHRDNQGKIWLQGLGKDDETYLLQGDNLGKIWMVKQRAGQENGFWLDQDQQDQIQQALILGSLAGQRNEDDIIDGITGAGKKDYSCHKCKF